LYAKKHGGRVFGASFTAAERKAMDLEIERQLAEYTKKHRVELSSMVLWVLRAQLGWGEKRLRRFYDEYDKELDALIERYEMTEEDRAWLCTRKLKEAGIDVQDWVEHPSGT
jgi:hypothetical protein